MAGRNGNRESMVRGLSTGKKDKEPHCPECGSLEITSRGKAWTCNDCGRYFLKKLRGRWKKDLADRPKSCIHCGAKSVENGELIIWANGQRWWCIRCRKSWIKDKGKYSRRQDKGERPSCPICGTLNPSSAGVRWLCVKCGKTWLKVHVPKPLSPTELTNAKIIQI